MTETWRWFLAVVGALMLAFGGLFWDAVIHGGQQHHVAEESLVNLSNPGHVVFGVGLGLTALFTLAGLTVSWSGAGTPDNRWAERWFQLSPGSSLD